MKRHIILYTVIMALLLLFIATLVYPGGSTIDHNNVGFNWKHNYISNLFAQKAINGSDSTSRYWAIAGMLFLSISFGLFYNDFSAKIPQRRDANVIKYFGIGAMIFSFLAVTPLHDSMITVADTMSLVSNFYITVYVFKTSFHLLKILCLLCLTASYVCTFVYYTQNFLLFLPIMQKISLVITVVWMLSLQYFSKASDFEAKSP